jgi:hypothetical protein
MKPEIKIKKLVSQRFVVDVEDMERPLILLPQDFPSPEFKHKPRGGEVADDLMRVFTAPLPAEVAALFQPALLAQFDGPTDESPQREAEIDRIYGLLHELPDSNGPDVLRSREQFTARLRDLQRREADAIDARFTENCELQPGEGYAALAIGDWLLAEYDED